MVRRARFPVVPPLAPTRGNALSRAFGRLVVCALGWGIEGDLPNTPKCVMIAAPHTSTLDIVVGVACKVALGLQIGWLGKHTVHKPPLSWVLRYLGAIAVDRSAHNGVVGELVREFRARPAMYLGLAPEGTRRRVTRWKTGFYQVALGAGVPIVTVALDYRDRTLRLGPPFIPTGDYGADLLVLRRRFSPAMAFRPERYADPEAPVETAMGPTSFPSRDRIGDVTVPRREGAE
jgi:1-acyl-sn-glycerol-3-phosphate acyltransferase